MVFKDDLDVDLGAFSLIFDDLMLDVDDLMLFLEANYILFNMISITIVAVNMILVMNL